MLFYDGPRDITKHLQDFEQRFNLADYDHGKPELSGWRSEMKEAQIKQSEEDQTEPSKFARLVSATGAWLRSGVVSTE